MTQTERSLQQRRSMLHQWAVAWMRRHERQLATERVRFPVRVGRRTFQATAEQALAAVSKTVQELDAALAVETRWGTGADGRPCEIAMRGLINRRFEARLVDAIRKKVDAWHAGVLSLSARASGDHDDSPPLAETLQGPSGISAREASLWVRQVLAPEAPATQEAVLRDAAGETATEIAASIGLSPAAVRKRISRFRRGPFPELVDAA